MSFTLSKRCTSKLCAISQLKRHRCGPVSFCTDHIKSTTDRAALPSCRVSWSDSAVPAQAGHGRRARDGPAGVAPQRNRSCAAVRSRIGPAHAAPPSPCPIRPVSVVPRLRFAPGESERDRQRQSLGSVARCGTPRPARYATPIAPCGSAGIGRWARVPL